MLKDSNGELYVGSFVVLLLRFRMHGLLVCSLVSVGCVPIGEKKLVDFGWHFCSKTSPSSKIFVGFLLKAMVSEW